MRFDRIDFCVVIGFLALAMVCGCESGHDPGLISTSPPALPVVGTTQIFQEGDFEIHVKLTEPARKQFNGEICYIGETTVYYPANWEIISIEQAPVNNSYLVHGIVAKTPLGIKAIRFSFGWLTKGLVYVSPANGSVMWKRKFLEVKK